MLYWNIRKANLHNLFSVFEILKKVKVDILLRFLRNLVLLTTNMENLPSNVFMTVRLLYYDKGKFKIKKKTIILLQTY